MIGKFPQQYQPFFFTFFFFKFVHLLYQKSLSSFRSLAFLMSLSSGLLIQVIIFLNFLIVFHQNLGAHILWTCINTCQNTGLPPNLFMIFEEIIPHTSWFNKCDLVILFYIPIIINPNVLT